MPIKKDKSAKSLIAIALSFVIGLTSSMGHYSFANSRSSSQASAPIAASPARSESDLESKLQERPINKKLKPVLDPLLSLLERANQFYLNSCCAGVPGVTRSPTNPSELASINSEIKKLNQKTSEYLGMMETEFEPNEVSSFSLVVDKVTLISTYFSVIVRILSAQVYSGVPISSISLSQYNLKMLTSAFNELSETSAGSAIRDSSSSSLILLEEAGEFVILKFNPASLLGIELAVSTSKNTDEGLKTMVQFPLLESLVNSLIRNQMLQGVANPTVPSLDGVDRRLSIVKLWPEINRTNLKGEAESRFRNALVKSFATLFLNGDQFGGSSKIENQENLSLEEIRKIFLSEAGQNLRYSNPQYLTEVDRLTPKKLSQDVNSTTMQATEILALPLALSYQVTSWASELKCSENCSNNMELHYKLTSILAKAFRSTQDLQLHSAVQKLKESEALTDFEIESVFGSNESVEATIGNREVDFINEHFPESAVIKKWIEAAIETDQEIFEQTSTEFRRGLVDVSISLSNPDFLLNSEPQLKHLLSTVLSKERDQPYLERSINWIRYISNVSDFKEAKLLFSRVAMALAKGIGPQIVSEISTGANSLDSKKVKNFLDSETEGSHSSASPSERLGQLSKTRQLQILREVLEIGSDMGFLFSEPSDSITARLILGRLANPDFTFPTLDWFKSFWTTDSDFYAEKYVTQIRLETLGQIRILDEEYSPEESIPVYEVIAKSCSGQSTDACQRGVAGLVNDILKKQEQQIRGLINELVTNDFSVERYLRYTEIIQKIKADQKSSLDLHSQRLTRLLTPTVGSEIFKSVSDDAAGISLTMLSVMAIRWMSVADQRFGMAAGLLTPFAESLTASAGGIATGYMVGVLPIFVAAAGNRINTYYSEEAPGFKTTRDLYYSSAEANDLVGAAMMDSNQRLAKIKKATVILDITTMGAIFLAPALVPIVKRMARLRFQGRVKTIESRLTKLGFDSPKQFNWDMQLLDDAMNAKISAALGGTPLTSASPQQIRTITEIRRSADSVRSFYESFRAGVYNHKLALAPVKQRLGIDPAQMNPDILRKEILQIRISTSSPERLAQLAVLEKSLTGKHIFLTAYAQQSPLMQRMAQRLLNARLEKVNGQIVETIATRSTQAPVITNQGSVFVIEGQPVWLANPSNNAGGVH